MRHPTLISPERMRHLLALALATATPAMPADSAAAPFDVLVNVRGVRDTAGQMRIAAHRDTASFPSDWENAAAMTDGKPAAGSTTLRLRLPGPGRYAFIALHDANGNGRMDKNLVGIPKEGFGTTDGQRGLRFPRFSAALRQVDAPVTVTIDMGYP